MDTPPLTDQELLEIEKRCSAATPGPWYPRATDDEVFSNALYVGLRPGEPDIDSLHHDNRPGLFPGHKRQEPPENVVAITLLQHPLLAEVGDGLWDENTLFIAHARDDVPRLIAEIRRLKAVLASLQPQG